MQFRESGMPSQDYWETLVDVPLILDAFGFNGTTCDVAELGSGYGTFTVPLARRINGIVYTVDIDPAMVEATRERAAKAGLTNVREKVADVVANGFGCPPASCDACLLFNILHCESPMEVLRAAREVVRPQGIVAVIHWRSDIVTPRGPNLSIRPRPAQISDWATAAELSVEPGSFTLAPWHFGMRLSRR